MSERNTAIRSLHDLGLAAWFGGSLMGAVGLNGAAKDEGGTETTTDRISSAGWAKWTPVNAAAIGAHLFGGGGLLAVNAQRVATQQGVAASTVAKTVVTAAALAATAYARVLGKKVELASSTDPDDLEKARQHPVDLHKARRQLACAQWAVPALTGCLVVLNALHGEQQRPSQQVPGMWERAMSATHFGG
ncbi:hypothetical protein ABZ722_31580 [Streptomyces longwoodensis]|uniref:Uncharacterized protein n=1 Tax=Streptomyces lasalocidi TaxID=324833 RepID=B5M9M5_STRLS|nr:MULTISPECIES: hypothetical protein [Streptomyces]MCX5000481.1 hypothetical protein [Streptomyces longwoodensis]TKS98850.1 hypothetical protein E4U91_01050 [Streptomyces lasalocidi]WTI49171.1 hypothetical protein OG547_33945 [Streptomyces longwoodensis]WUC61872.1 hypothetical protein OHA09_34635 [Streptomyces longwoodensis]WUC75443.1 hypothetical protein OG416_33930 [Streptomyces longwoodensis]